MPALVSLAPPPIRGLLRDLALSLVFGAVLPFALYELLSAERLPTLHALLVTSGLPLGWMFVCWVRRRRLDAVALTSIVVIVVGMLSAVVSGNARLYLVKEAAISGVMGVTWLASLLLPRPLMFYIGRQLSAGNDVSAVAVWNSRWEGGDFRRDMRYSSGVWGVGLLAQAAIRAGIALLWPPSVVLIIGPVVDIGGTLLLIAWTLRHRRARRQQNARRSDGLQIGEAAEVG